MLRRARNWLILIAVLAVLACAYTAAGFFGVPALLRAQLTDFAREHYGRTISIGEIRFNPFTFALRVRDFSFPDADGQPLLAFHRLLVDLDVATAWRRAPSFTSIELEQPHARILIRPDGTLNLNDLAKPFAGAAQKPEASGEPMRLFIDHLAVRAGELSFEDRARPSPFRTQLRPITFDLRDFSTRADTDNAYALQGSSAAGERFMWRGTFSVQPLASRGTFEVANLQAHTIWSYLRDALDFELSNGVVGFGGEYVLAAGETPALRVSVPALSLADLGIRPKGGKKEDVRLARLEIANTHVDLADKRVELGSIRLQGGSVHAQRDSEGHINLLDLAHAPAEPQATSPSAPVGTQASSGLSAASDAGEADSPWHVSAPDIAIEGLRVDVDDRLVEPAAQFALDVRNLKVSGFDTANEARLGIEADLGIDETGRLTLRGEVQPRSGAATAHLEMRGFDLASLQPYLDTYTQMTLLHGALQADLDVARSEAGALQVKGSTEITKLRTIDKALHQDLIKWDRLRVTGIDYSSAPARLRIDAIDARAPYARLIIAPDQRLNVSEVLKAPAERGASAVQTARTSSGENIAPTPSEPLPISIRTVRIASGSANFADFWIKPNYAVSLQGLSGTIVGLSSDPRSRARVDLQGKVDRYAPAHIAGEINLLSAALFTNLAVSFKGVEMNSVTPYSGRFAGYKIEKGKLSIDVAYHVENRKLDAEQHFIVDQLQLGERVESPDAVKLPLRLAVALLKDRNGIIDIDLPLSGSLDDPQFRLGPLIWKAIVGLFTKVVTSPFALLGRLGGGGEEINRIDFEPGSATLDAAAQERLRALAKALQERPQLQLDVPASYASEIDKPALASRKLDERLLQLAEQQASRRRRSSDNVVDENVLTDPARRFDLLAAQYRLDFGEREPLPPAAQPLAAARKKKVKEPPAFDAANGELASALEQKNPVGAHDLEQLGEARAHAIQEALLASGEIEPGRVFLLAPKETTPQDNRVRVELSLK